jgi:transposase
VSGSLFLCLSLICLAASLHTDAARPHRQELRRQLSVRRALIETRTQYVTTIRGIGREYGLPLPSCDAEDFAARLRRKPLPTELAALVNPLVTLLETLEVQLFTVEQRLSALSAQEPIIAQLTSTPGVGRIVAASFVSVIDDAHRFRNAHQVELLLRVSADVIEPDLAPAV